MHKRAARTNIEQEAVRGCFWRVFGKKWLKRRS
jgi:hypothetical protein